MKIDVLGVHEKSDVFEFDCPPDEIGIDDENGLQISDTVHLTCHVHRDSDVAVIESDVRAIVKLECSRCLETFEREIVGNFSLVARKMKKGEILKSTDEEEDEEGQNDDTDIVILDSDTNNIDITEYVHDALLLALPLKPVCREECRGLCDICGHNLNEGDCSCIRKRSDNRWNELSGLINENFGHDSIDI